MSVPRPPGAVPPPPPQRGSGNAVWIVLVVLLVVGFLGCLACAGVAAALLLPAVTAARSTAQERASENYARQLAFALNLQATQEGGFEGAAWVPPGGTEPISWRVAVLPWLDQSPLRKAYDDSKPWDDPANRPLLEQMPEVFRSPRATGPEGATSYVVVAGQGTVFENDRGWQRMEIGDGPAHTLLLVEWRESDIPWTEPRDLDLADVDDWAHRMAGAVFVTCDGAVHEFPEEVTAADIRALATVRGNEPPPRWRGGP